MRGLAGRIVLTVLVAASVAAGGAGAEARDRVRVVGSSTIFPYSQAVAEQYAGLTHAVAPVIEATGTGGGIRIFCGGVGSAFPDIVGGSRRMTAAEYRDCASNGAGDITEARIGADGLSLTQSLDGAGIALTRAQLFLALAAEVPAEGDFRANPYRRWHDIDAELPDTPIRVYGPPPGSGTREALVALAVQPGCAVFPDVAALDPARRVQICSQLRQDGPYIDGVENDNVIVRRLRADPTAVGVSGFSFLHENAANLRGIAIDGVAPSVENLATGAYKLTRPLYLYIKNAHRAVIPGMEDFLREYLSEEAIAPDGYLTALGLVPLDASQRQRVRAAVASRVRVAGLR